MSLARAAKSLFGGISPRPTDPARPPRTTLLEIDWEYPQNSSEARAYVNLLAKCRYELDDLARRKGRPAGTYELTVSPPACERRVTTRRHRGLTGGPDGSRAGRRSQRKGQLRQVGYQGDGAVRRFLELDGKPGFVVSNRDHRADVIGLRVDVRCRSGTMNPAPQSCSTLTRTDSPRNFRSLQARGTRSRDIKRICTPPSPVESRSTRLSSITYRTESGRIRWSSVGGEPQAEGLDTECRANTTLGFGRRGAAIRPIVHGHTRDRTAFQWRVPTFPAERRTRLMANRAKFDRHGRRVLGEWVVGLQGVAAPGLAGLR